MTARTKARCSSPVLLVLLLAGLAARAEELPTSWADPLLEDALAGCALVVRGTVESPGADPKVKVDRVLFGDAKPGDVITVHKTRGANPIDAFLRPLAPGDEAFFILRKAGDAGRLELPTPTFGRFAIQNGWVAASVRDSFVRVELHPETYEAFLRFAAAKAQGRPADVAFVDSCRKTLAALDATAPDAQTAAHVALEGLCYGAAPADVDLALRYFASPLYQVRLSAARLLGHAGSERAGAALLRLALNDKDRAVRSVALRGIQHLRKEDVPAKAVDEILARLKDLDSTDVTLFVSPDDPRSNELPSNLLAAFETLRSIGAGERATPVAIDLLGSETGDVLGAACLHLAKMKDASRVKAIVARMRPKEANSPFTLANQLIADTLEELTGVALGPDRARWEEWLAKNPDPKPPEGR